MDAHTHFTTARKGRAAGLTLASLAKQMRLAVKDHNVSASAATAARLEMGRLATIAKGMIPHGGFIPWVEKQDFGCTVQWVRICMRAVKALELAEQRPDAESYRHLDVDTLAKIHRRLKAGVPDPLTAKLRNENLVTVADLRARIRYLEDKLDAAGIRY